MKKESKFKLFTTSSVVFVFAISILSIAYYIKPVQAAPATFTVNSTANGADATPGDGLCATAGAICTWQAAVQESNANTGADTINFSIAGVGPHVISPTVDATFTDQVTINGYSEPDATTNTTAHPAAFDASLSVEIDLTAFGAGDYMQFNGGASGSANSSVRGLSIYNSSGSLNRLIVSAANIAIEGNYLGVTSAEVAESEFDIRALTPAAASFTLGGTGVDDRNVVNGTVLAQPPVTGTITIRGNYMGLSPDGLTALNSSGINPTGVAGVSVINNVIGNCDTYCVIGDADSTIQGNYLGTDRTGNVAISDPYQIGVSAGSGAVNVGGSGAGEGNVMAGFTIGGIRLDAGPNSVIQGNYVGIGADGSTDLAAEGGGINIRNSDGTTVGGVDAGNVVAGIIDNGGGFVGNGITVENASDNVTIVGNFVGTNATGTDAIANAGNGIDTSLSVSGSQNLTIGGSAAGEGNVISGNTGDGMYISSMTGATIKGNLIGLESDGTTSMPNGGDGITINDSTGVVVGGILSADSNLIYNNGDEGIDVTGTSLDNPILRNSIFNNTGLGIDLNNDGITANDSEDTDAGSNNLLNFPSQIYFNENGGNTDIELDLDVPAGDYRVQFYSNTAVDGSGNGEGRTFLGHQNITSTGAVGSETFTTTLTGVSLQNVVATVTEIDGAADIGFAATSEFSAPAEQLPPEADLEISKVFDNPEDVALGADLNFTITITNNGPDPVDLAAFDGSGVNPLATSLFTDILPEDLAYESNSNANITCSWYGDGSASLTGPLLANRLTSSVLPCAFNTTGTLTSGQSISTTITASVNNDSDLEFENYVFTGALDDDPDTAELGAAFANGDSDVDTDMIDEMRASEINNFDYTTPVADIDIVKTLSNPEDVSPGQTITYDIEFRNNGPMGVDLSSYSEFTDSLVSDIYPAQDLTFTGDTDANVTCSDLGPGSISFLGAAGEDHPDHQIILCMYTGVSNILEAGDAFNLSLEFSVNNDVGATFTNYASMQNLYSNDVDTSSLLSALGGSSDILDTVENDNFASATFGTAPVDEEDSGSSDSDNSASDDLSDTGSNVKILLILAVLLTMSGAGLYYDRVGRRRAYKIG